MNQMIQNQMMQQQYGNARFYENATPGKILKERIREPLYSRKLFAVDKAQTKNFFRDHAGGTLLDSNLVQNGAMPSTQKFEVEGFSVRLAFGTPKADIIKFYNSAVLIFKIGDTIYLRAPLAVIPSGGGLKGVAALALDGASSAVTGEFIELCNGEPHPMAFYPIIRRTQQGHAAPIIIAPQQTFEVDIQTFAAADFSDTFYATVYMHGQRSRESQ